MLFNVKKKPFAKFFLIAALLSSLLSGCFVPEEFESEIKISKDGTFEFVFDGVLTFALAKAEEVKTGKMSPKLQKELKELEGKFKEDPRYVHVKYIGNAQYKVVFKDKGTLDEPYSYFEKSDFQTSPALITITPKKNKLIEVTGMKIDEKDIAQLTALNMKIDGVLNITTNGEVIEHNAKSSPSMFGLFGSYKWEIKSMNDPMPRIVIKL